MAYDFKSETEVKEFIKNLGIEYRFGCYSEKKPEVCHLLADYLESIDKNFDKAGKVYKNTCDEFKYARSCGKFGTYSLLGKGLKNADYKGAYNYFEKGCNLDDPDSCLHQGLLLITENDLKGIPRNVAKGMSILEKACSANNSNACYYLSGMYIAGVKSKQHTDPAKKPASGTTPTTITTTSTGKAEVVNNNEVDRDMEKAFKFAVKGCEIGNMFCCANLSQMYAKGDGVAKNPELAAKYKAKAMEMQKNMEERKTLTFQEGLT